MENGGSMREADIPIVALNLELIEQLKEQFIESVFGAKMYIKREEFVENIATQAPWILNSGDIRAKVKEILRNKQQASQLSASNIKWSEIGPATPQTKDKVFRF